MERFSVRMSGYAGYILAEWEHYQAQPKRFQASLAATAGRHISRVLDVGCGAGQELLPFVQGLGARGAGVDISPQAIKFAQTQFAKQGCDGQVEFFCSPAESLPFTNATFDLVVCRLVLPYTGNTEALSEIARVLRPGGLLILKIHHFRYYARQLWLSLRHCRILEAASIAKIVVNGMLYHLTGRQPKQRLKPREVFQTRWMLRRILRKVALRIRKELENSDSNQCTPVFLIEKMAALSSQLILFAVFQEPISSQPFSIWS